MIFAIRSYGATNGGAPTAGNSTYRLGQEPRVGVLWVYAKSQSDGSLKNVGSVATIECVGSVATTQNVVAVEAVDDVVAATAADDVIAGGAVKDL